MSGDLSHLNTAAADLLQEPNDQRIRAILSERWVQYARAGQVMRILNLLLEHPRTTRMPSIAVYGDSNQATWCRPPYVIAQTWFVGRDHLGAGADCHRRLRARPANRDRYAQ
ncbi:MAG: TniB family NTP-binding protein [Dyella sp.]|nr:TniB family NTP-binding protein [Dyella sp.]